MQKRYKYNIKDIAKLLTDDPDVFAEARPLRARPGGNRKIKANITVNPKPNVKVASKDVRDKITVEPKPTAMPQPQPTQPGETRTMKKLGGEDGETTNESAPTHLCRNSVYRRGTVGFCLRPTNQRVCLECKEARESLSEWMDPNKCKGCGKGKGRGEEECKNCDFSDKPAESAEPVSGDESAAARARKKTSQYYSTNDSTNEEKSKKKSSKKNKSPKLKKVDIDGKFKVHDGLEDKKEPAKVNKKQKRKSSLQKGPDGSKQSKKSAYIKPKKPKKPSF